MTAAVEASLFINGHELVARVPAVGDQLVTLKLLKAAMARAIAARLVPEYNEHERHDLGVVDRLWTVQVNGTLYRHTSVGSKGWHNTPAEAKQRLAEFIIEHTEPMIRRDPLGAMRPPVDTDGMGPIGPIITIVAGSCPL